MAKIDSGNPPTQSDDLFLKTKAGTISELLEVLQPKEAARRSSGAAAWLRCKPMWSAKHKMVGSGGIKNVNPYRLR